MRKTSQEIIYPDSDGKPMADNSVQLNWMVKLYTGLREQYANDPNTLVCCNLLWYPVEGNNRLRVAPDAMVILGRPSGDRGSYCQWLEGGVPPTVTFEVLSPGNWAGELQRKFRFFQRYGVQEYYLYDPSRAILQGWQRRGRRLMPIPETDGWASPLLGIRFDLASGDLRIFSKTGKEFLFTDQAIELQEHLAERAEEAERREQTERLAKEALAAKLRELGIDPDTITQGK
jgi:Uma2 family endonuclease